MIEIFNNIRQLYRFYPPNQSFSPYIEFFSETDVEHSAFVIREEKFTVKLFPSFTPTIWMNLGSPYQLFNGNIPHQVDERTDVLVLRSQTIERKNAPSDNIFTIKFLPGGFEAIFGISQNKIAENVVSLSDLMPKQIINKIKGAPDFETRIKLWEDYLTERKSICAQNHYLHTVQKSTNVFLAAGMGLSLSQLADKVCMSERSMNRYFNEVVGTGPKNYFNTIKARTSITEFIKAPEDFSCNAYGYYDMSHFYRDAIRFTGTRLSQI